jgi:hypothetical protein
VHDVECDVDFNPPPSGCWIATVSREDDPVGIRLVTVVAFLKNGVS